MSRRDRWILILVGVPGLTGCLLAVGAFLWRVLTNGLPFHPKLSAQEHYQAVGGAYSSGFVAGFFLCFFLVLVILAASTALSRYRRPRLVENDRWPGQTISPKRSA